MEFLAPRPSVAGAILAPDLSAGGAIAGDGGLVVDAAYPASRVLIARKYGGLDMTDVSIAQAVQGITVRAVFA